jgi:hypothetical protein
VLRPGALGDTLLCVPALRCLRRRYGHLTLAAHGAAARFLAELGEVDAGWAFDDPRVSWVFGARQAPAGPPDVVAWMDASPLALIPVVAAAPPRPDAQPAAGRQVHVAVLLARSVGGACQLDARPLRLTPLVADEVLVHPGSGSPRKNWPPERFAAVIRALPRVRLIVGEADVEAAQAVEHALGRALPRLHCPPLSELAARLAGCRAYLGNDSGVSHLAGLSGARTVVLFGPTPADVWRPLGARVTTVDFQADDAAIVPLLSGAS